MYVYVCVCAYFIRFIRDDCLQCGDGRDVLPTVGLCTERERERERDRETETERQRQRQTE